jgi:hypothetical protein
LDTPAAAQYGLDPPLGVLGNAPRQNMVRAVSRHGVTKRSAVFENFQYSNDQGICVMLRIGLKVRSVVKPEDQKLPALKLAVFISSFSVR